MDLSVPFEFKPNHEDADAELEFTCKMDGCGDTVKVSALRTHAAMKHDTTRYHTNMVKR